MTNFSQEPTQGPQPSTFPLAWVNMSSIAGPYFSHPSFDQRASLLWSQNQQPPYQVQDAISYYSYYIDELASDATFAHVYNACAAEFIHGASRHFLQGDFRAKPQATEFVQGAIRHYQQGETRLHPQATEFIPGNTEHILRSPTQQTTQFVPLASSANTEHVSSSLSTVEAIGIAPESEDRGITDSPGQSPRAAHTAQTNSFLQLSPARLHAQNAQMAVGSQEHTLSASRLQSVQPTRNPEPTAAQLFNFVHGNYGLLDVHAMNFIPDDQERSRTAPMRDDLEPPPSSLVSSDAQLPSEISDVPALESATHSLQDVSDPGAAGPDEENLSAPASEVKERSPCATDLNELTPAHTLEVNEPSLNTATENNEHIPTPTPASNETSPVPATEVNERNLASTQEVNAQTSTLAPEAIQRIPEEQYSWRQSWVLEQHDGATNYHDYDVQVLVADRCVHHFNFFGYPVTYKSWTKPATSIAILKASSKRLNLTNPSDMRMCAVMYCAMLLLDPIVYYGKKEVFESLHGTALENACIGQCAKIYSKHGWWKMDTWGPEEDKPIEDTLNSADYSDKWVIINGCTNGFSNRVDILSAATEEQHKEDMKRKAAVQARIARGHVKSRLSALCLVHDDLEEVPAFTVPLPKSRTWGRRATLRNNTSTLSSRAIMPVQTEVPQTSQTTITPAAESMSREEFNKRCNETMRPPAKRWADDGDDDESNDDGPDSSTVCLGTSNNEEIVPSVPSAPSTSVPVSSSTESTSSATTEPSTTVLDDSTQLVQGAVPVEGVVSSDHQRSVSSSTTATAMHSRTSSVSVAETTETSVQASDGGNVESAATSDDECDNIYGVASDAGDGHECSDNDIFQMTNEREYEAVHGGFPSYPVDASEGIEAGGDVYGDIATTTTPSSSDLMLTTAPNSMVRVSTPIPGLSLINGTVLSVTTTLLASPESRATAFVASTQDTPRPRHVRGLLRNTRDPPVFLPSPADSSSSPINCPEAIFRRFPNGAITMTLPGQTHGLVRSPGMLFNSILHQVSQTRPELVLEARMHPALSIEDVPVQAELATAEAVDQSSAITVPETEQAGDVPEVTNTIELAAAVVHNTAPLSSALVLYRPQPFQLDSLSYFLLVWSHLLARAASNEEHFWQCVLRRVGIEAWMDTRIQHNDAVVTNSNVSERDVARVVSLSSQANKEHDHEEDIVGTVIHPAFTVTRDTEVNNTVVTDIAPETATDESIPLVPTPDHSLASSSPSMGTSSVMGTPLPHRRVRFSLPVHTLSMASTASPTPSMVTVYRLSVDSSPMPESAYDQWPDFGGAHYPTSSTAHSVREVSRSSQSSSNLSSAGNFDHNDEALAPVPSLPTFRRTRAGWRRASWSYVQRTLTKRQSTTVATENVKTGADWTEPLLPSAAARLSVLNVSRAKKDGLWKKTVKVFKGMFAKKERTQR